MLFYMLCIAIQAWALSRLVPVYAGRYVPHNDENWDNFLTMLTITGYLMSPEITPEEAAFVKVLIEQHHTQFKMLYPNASITPKMHYLIHMPRLIMM